MDEEYVGIFVLLALVFVFFQLLLNVFSPFTRPRGEREDAEAPEDEWPLAVGFGCGIPVLGWIILLIANGC